VLTKNQLDVGGSMELLPETIQTNALSGNPMNIGLSGQITYGFTDKLNIGARITSSFEENAFQFDGRTSAILTGQYKQPTSNGLLIYIPRVGIALDANSIEGSGYGLSAIFHQVAAPKFAWYGGIGGFWGVYALQKVDNRYDEEKRQMGFGIVSNIGASYNLGDHLRANIEFNPTYHLNTFDEISSFVIAPQIGFGYTFKKK
jgi:hypothetical protein